MPQNKFKMTRYFVFWRTDPKPSDYELLRKKCEEINAFFGYTTLNNGDKKILKGFIILRGVKTISDGSSLHAHFPNFMIRGVGTKCDMNLEALRNLTLNGVHPYEGVRRRLFDDDELIDFFSKFDIKSNWL